MTKRRFLVIGPKDNLPTESDIFVLRKDRWNDYGSHVQFYLYYLNTDGQARPIGNVKILQRNDDTKSSVVFADTVLPAEFYTLDKKFISIGQKDDYYKDLFNQFVDETEDVLDCLQDIAWNPALASPFETSTVFRNALMRENSAVRNRRFGRIWAQGEDVFEKFAFQYSGMIDGAQEATHVEFNFDAKDLIPGHVVGIIGRNAVGKTRFLAKLADDLSQISRSSAERLFERDKRFSPGRPLFTRVVAVSYSAFDRFKRPSHDVSNSYVYCGIRTESGGISRTYLYETYLANRKRVSDNGLDREWANYMRRILGDHGAPYPIEELLEGGKDKFEDGPLSLMSSGQAISTHFVTALLAWIQPYSIVLFDEPETHLHPNAVANLFGVFVDILANFESFAIVATHSPVVIQEIPGKRIALFKREGDITTSEPLGLESFGESVSELTRHVFETVNVEHQYRKTLKELSGLMPYREVMAMFRNGLSVSAQSFLLAQYNGDLNK